MDGIDIMLFILKKQVPRDRIKYVTYGRIVVDYRPKKQEPHRTLHTVGEKLRFMQDMLEHLW